MAVFGHREVDFINKFIFPGGVLPSLTFMVNAITNGSKKRLIVDSIENIGPRPSPLSSPSPLGLPRS